MCRLYVEMRTVVELCVSLITRVSDAHHMCDFADNKSTGKLCLTEYGTATKHARKGQMWSGESCDGELIMNVLATLVSRSWSAFVWRWIDAKEFTNICSENSCFSPN
jgi:hypothetical protein